MGKNNRKRRAAKAHKRSRQPPPSARARRRPWSPGADPSSSGFADRLVAAVYAEGAGDHAAVRRLLPLLDDHPARAAAVDAAALLEAQVARCWDQGWQPADLARLVDRDLGALDAVVLRSVIAAHAATYEALGTRVAPGWMAQLDHIGATRRWDPSRPYLLQLQGYGWPQVLAAAVGLMAWLLHLPVLQCVGDPPSAWREGPTRARPPLPGGVLDKVRALLAKAESTTFDAEAEALTAKAQELMARHRIDRAVLDATATATGDRAGGETPAARRIGVEDPYAEAKAALLGKVAHANGGRAVWSKELGFSTVFGFADDLVAIEELFTSLLVQATAALGREGSKRDALGRSRTTRFRRSFLVAYAVRIGQRLSDTVDATVEAASAEAGTALVPILAARDEAAKAAADAAFPDMKSFAPTANDGEGWFAGTLFGDRADLGIDPVLTR